MRLDSIEPTDVEIQFNYTNSTRTSSIVRIDSQSKSGAFSVVSINLGSAASVLVSADTGDSSLADDLSMCQTDQTTGECINSIVPTTDPLKVDIAANETPTFAVFVSSTEAVPLDPTNSRVFVRFAEANGVTRGATSVAVTTQ